MGEISLERCCDPRSVEEGILWFFSVQGATADCTGKMGNRASYNQVPIGDTNSPSIRASALTQKAADSSRPAENNTGILISHNINIGEIA